MSKHHIHTQRELAEIAVAKEMDARWPQRPDGSQMEMGEWNDKQRILYQAGTARFVAKVVHENPLFDWLKKRRNHKPGQKDK